MKIKNLSNFLENIGLLKISDIIFSNKKNTIYITIDSDYVIGNDDNRELFKIPCDASIGTFLVILQEFNIINKRYIYERIDAIGEEFFEDEEEY